MPLITDAETTTKTTITSAWGTEVNDRIVQVFDTRAQLMAGSYTNWAPIRGSLAFCLDTSSVYRCTGLGTDSLYHWEPLNARGELGFKANANTSEDKTLTNVSGQWTEVVVISASTFTALQKMGIRKGKTYLYLWAGTPYIKTGSLSLWDSQAYIRKRGTTAAIGGITYIRKCGTGWCGNLFAARMQSGATSIPAAYDADDIEFVWRAATLNGYPTVTMSQGQMSIVEVGGPS
jgi:hypothetical protein